MSNSTDGIALARPEEGTDDMVFIDPLKITPLDCRVLCKVVDWGNVTDGGIILPGGKKGRGLTIMKVIKVGDGRTTDHGIKIGVRVKPGDYVVVGEHAGHQVGKSAKLEYKILNEVEILGIQEVGE
ncbi:MAG: co-chaperone GroES family protein [Nitrospira sp.]